MNNYFILNDDNQPVPADLITWAQWESTNRERRVVKKEEPITGVVVSTVFLGLNHAFGEGEPVLYETMVFGGKHDGYQNRYHTREQAEQGHREAVQMLFE